MARNYAGVLGSLAFLTVLIRGWRASVGIDETLLSAWLALVAFAAAGLVVGWLAEWITIDAVRTKVSAELDAQHNATAAGTQDNVNEAKARAA